MDVLPQLRVVFEVLLVVGALASWGFVIRYTATYRWWETEIGRHLISWSSVVGAFLTYYVLVFIWPTIPGRMWIRLFLFVALIAVIVWRLVMFERLRWRSKKEK
ncbi:MAG: hypothetical protein AUG44_08740 [Actinobacteria bacterium 13_1_20CM_3_71_11]|nr:MAG: hypothetical protein AUG44_08740 [Actinobacteria bacterium 13_1_20CM_3_71_11]